VWKHWGQAFPPARPHLLIAHSAINSPFDQSSEVSTLII
jgi:hypothetical protein